MTANDTLVTVLVTANPAPSDITDVLVSIATTSTSFNTRNATSLVSTRALARTSTRDPGRTNPATDSADGGSTRETSSVPSGSTTSDSPLSRGAGAMGVPSSAAITGFASSPSSSRSFLTFLMSYSWSIGLPG